MPNASRDLGPLRPAPSGLPAELPNPPILAESGDPFAALRIIDLVARVARGRPLDLAALVDHLNARHPGWLFERRVVADALIQLQSNWLSDYRNASGFRLEEGPDGATLEIEDSSRVDPWIVGQARRVAAACAAALADFSRRDRATGAD